MTTLHVEVFWLAKFEVRSLTTSVDLPQNSKIENRTHQPAIDPSAIKKKVSLGAFHH